MKSLDFDWQIDEFMIYCRSTQLREKTMNSYEQTLRLFERWCVENLNIATVDKVSEAVIRRYINDLQDRGKYTFYADDSKKHFAILKSNDVLYNYSILNRKESTWLSTQEILRQEAGA